MKTLKAVKGWYFDESLDVYRIPIRIKNPQTNISIIKFCLFDTGYSGYLGLDKESINTLNLPNLGQGKGITIKGIIDYNNYEGMIEIVDENELSLMLIKKIDANSNQKNDELVVIQEFDIPILGIKSIKQFSWLILRAEKAIYLLK